jgi:2-polyprenyl-3-methyl-5-hydroxy-6-metoxy-1,4-benzoquinol methylase
MTLVNRYADTGTQNVAVTESPALPLLFRDAAGWWAVVLLALGRETRMLDAIIANPVTASELANCCRVDERNATAWLAAMAAHGYVTHSNGTFTMLPSEAAAFRGEVSPFDFHAILDFCSRAPVTWPAVLDAIRTGSGVAPSTNHEAYGDAISRINLPLYRLMLLDDWLAHAGVTEDLKKGVEVAELGCGSGAVLISLAERCPASRFTGYDLDVHALNAAAVESVRRGLKNVRFKAADAASVSGGYHLILVLDAFHHFPHPEVALHAIASSLLPGGKLVLAEATAAGNVDSDIALPWARIVFSANVLVCLQEALHDNGAGLGSTAGARRITSLLEDSGFTQVNQYDTPVGYTVYTASR